MRIIDGDETELITYTMKQKETLLKKNDENRIERREEALKKWRINNKKAVNKINRMCIKAVQIKFKSE